MARLIGYPDAGASVWSDGSPASVILNAEFFGGATPGVATCVPTDATSATTLGSPTVVARAVAAPESATSPQSLTSPTMAPKAVAVPQDTTSGQTLGSPAVTVPGAAVATLHGRKKVVRGRRLTLPGDVDYVPPVAEPEIVPAVVVEAPAVVPLFSPAAVAAVANAASEAAGIEAQRLVDDAAAREMQRRLQAAAYEIEAQIAASLEAEALHRARLLADDEWLMLAA